MMLCYLLKTEILHTQINNPQVPNGYLEVLELLKLCQLPIQNMFVFTMQV
jgi:hypothetical protein